MGCGCRGGKGRNTRRTVSPITNRSNDNGRLRALENKSIERVDITGMTKQQRDEERKKRIQQIIAKRRSQ